MSSQKFSTSSMAAGAFGAVILLTLGIIAGTLLSRSAEPTSAPTEVATSTETDKTNLAGLPFTNGMSPEVATFVDTTGVSDPEVTAWHDTVVSPITAVLATLNKPAPTTADELASMCEMMILTMGDLKSAKKAPQDEIESAYRTWVTGLDSAATQCGNPADSGQERLQNASEAFRGTANQFDRFIDAMDPFFDFSAQPEKQPGNTE